MAYTIVQIKKITARNDRFQEKGPGSSERKAIEKAPK